MELAYLVKPLSAVDIELDSLCFIQKYQPEVLEGKEPLDVEMLLDNIFLDKGFSLQLISDDELPNGILGVSEMDNKIIKIRESDYLQCDSKGYPRMTITHEVGHSRIHSPQFEENRMQLCRTQSPLFPTFRSSEWQANVWASATLMPFPVITGFTNENPNIEENKLIDAVAKKFIVSKKAAKVRLETIRKYSKDGRYQQIELAMKKKGLYKLNV